LFYLKKNCFIILTEATVYHFPILLVPTYILLGRFYPISFKIERLVCVETDRMTDGHVV